MGPTCGPHRGPVGPDNMGPTSGPCGTRCGPTGPRNQLYVGSTIVFQKKLLNSDKINMHSTYAAPHKTLRTSVKSICTSRTTNPQKTPQDFCKTNPLNVYRWRVKSPHTFTHCIYHNIDTYDNCHIQACRYEWTHGRSIDIFQRFTPHTHTFNNQIKFGRTSNKIYKHGYKFTTGLSEAPTARHFSSSNLFYSAIWSDNHKYVGTGIHKLQAPIVHKL